MSHCRRGRLPAIGETTKVGKLFLIRREGSAQKVNAGLNDERIALSAHRREQGPGARVMVELGAEAARTMVATILSVLDKAEAGGFLE